MKKDSLWIFIDFILLSILAHADFLGEDRLLFEECHKLYCFAQLIVG
jgi:hypothetical protein